MVWTNAGQDLFFVCFFTWCSPENWDVYSINYIVYKLLGKVHSDVTRNAAFPNFQIPQFVTIHSANTAIESTTARIGTVLGIQWTSTFFVSPNLTLEKISSVKLSTSYSSFKKWKNTLKLYMETNHGFMVFLFFLTIYLETKFKWKNFKSVWRLHLVDCDIRSLDQLLTPGATPTLSTIIAWGFFTGDNCWWKYQRRGAQFNLKKSG